MSGPINSTIPTNISINGRSGSSGFLESKFGPLPIGNPNAGLANSKAADYLDETRFGGRLSMAQKMNASFFDTYDQKQVRAYTDLYNDAIKLMRSEDLKAFDIASESDAMKDMYGRSFWAGLFTCSSIDREQCSLCGSHTRWLGYSL